MRIKILNLCRELKKFWIFNSDVLGILPPKIDLVEIESDTRATIISSIDGFDLAKGIEILNRTWKSDDLFILTQLLEAISSPSVYLLSF